MTSPNANSLVIQEETIIITRPSSPNNTRDKNCDNTAIKENEDFRCSKTFADKDYWSMFFPQIAYDETKESTLRKVLLSKRNRALLLQVGIVGAILITNFTLTIFAATHFGSSRGVGVIYQGSCVTVQQLDTYIHLLINLLGTGMLMASNFCMQLQAAPTRENVNDAHKSGYWLDIGVPSLRNFRWISKSRQFCWLLLALSSIPVHLIYNSAVFQSLASDDYAVAVVSPAFLTGGAWNITAAKDRGAPSGTNDSFTIWVSDDRPGHAKGTVWQIPGLTPENTLRDMQQNASTAGLYLKQSVSECYAGYADYWSALGNLVVVVKNQSVSAQVNDTLLIFASVIPRYDNWAKNAWAYKYAFQGPHDNLTVSNWYLGPEDYEVDYCLVQPAATSDERCRFEYSPEIMVTICVINLAKTLIIFATWFMRAYQWDKQTNPQKEVLYTLGDAISSFMRSEDHTTRDMCLAPKDDFITTRKMKDHFVRKIPSPSQEPRPWEERKTRWWKAASVQRWFYLIISYLIVLSVAIALLTTAFTPLHRRGINTSIASFWNLGFGKLTPYTYIVLPSLPRSDPNGLIANVMIANLPQFILSILYLFCNSMLSCFLIQREFSRMWTLRKPLRVSEPWGIQRSSYFISLPLRYGIPLYVTSGMMHWLISQSLFLARVTAFYPDGTVDNMSSFSSCAYSPIAIVITIIVAGVTVLALIGLGFRSYDGTMPLVSTNSRAISAACHPPDRDRGAGYLLPVIWGVTEINDEGIGHCTFTTAADIKTVRDAGAYGAKTFK